MTDVRKFNHPEKKPTDYLLARDPLPEGLSLEARQIYLRIIRESKPGVLLRCDRLFVQVTAQMVELALSGDGDEKSVDSIKEAFDLLLAPELGQDYINQVLAKR